MNTPATKRTLESRKHTDSIYYLEAASNPSYSQGIFNVVLKMGFVSQNYSTE